MADEEVIDADLLALADDDSDSEQEDTKPTSRDSRSLSPPAGSKPTTRGVAQKKRPTTKKRGRDDDEDEGEVSPADSLGSGAMSESDSDTGPPATSNQDGPLFPVDGKFRSEAEKIRIMNLPEVERETILAERLEEAQQAAQRAQLRQWMESREKQASHDKKRRADTTELEDTPRKRSTAKSRTSENLAAYRRQREQRHEQRKRGDERRARGERSRSREDPYSDRDADGESDVEWDDAPKAAPPRDEPPAQLRDFERVRVGRSNFAKVCYYPGFEEAIRGCFCRVAIGLNRQTGENQYRMTQIKGFTTGREYQMESNGRPFRCNLYAILAHGKAEKEWPFTACSDSRLSQSEFERYRDILHTENLRAPTISTLAAKCGDIQALLDHRWTEDEITEKLRRQGWLTSQQTAVEKDRLLAERARAIADGNESAIARLDGELASLEGSKSSTSNVNNASAKPKVLTQQERLAAINRANRKANAEEIRKAQIAERKRNAQLQAAIDKGEALPNPFARVKTKPKTHYNTNEGDRLQVPRGGIDDLFGDGASDASRAATPVPAAGPKTTPALAGNGTMKAKPKRKVADDEVLAAMDLGIEIDI